MLPSGSSPAGAGNLDQDNTEWYRLGSGEACERLGSDSVRGLTAEEAGGRLRRYGTNALPSPPRRSIPGLLLGQFRDLMILILLGAAAVAAVIGEPQDSITILVIVLLNAVIGVVQQYRAENALAALRDMATPSALVVRDGEPRSIAAAELVPGDLVRLEAGAVVPADLRLLQAADLEVDESMLTGESVPVVKSTARLDGEDLPVGDQVNLAFRGTLATRGRARGLVIATGMATRMGDIAALLDTENPLQSPLQRRLAAFGKRLSLLVLVICAVIFFAGVQRGEPVMLMLLTAISLAVAAIPEALPAVVSISLAIGAHRMSHQRALVRSLPAVETLGSVSVICSDKTGTLTENRMYAERFVTALGEYDQLPPAGSDDESTCELLGRAMALSNDVQRGAEGLIGDPTEVALYEAAARSGFDRNELERTLPRTGEVPFTSERQRMSSLHGCGDTAVLFVKGAPEALLDLCDHQYGAAGRESLDKDYWVSRVQALADEGYRVLAFATRRVEDTATDDTQALEESLALLGLVALMDPPRPEARDAVAQCSSAGILPVMITGDHPGTALAIARRLNIADDAGQVVTGEQLKKVSDAALPELVQRARVYARVSPRQKIRLVKALQAQGLFVAMTGDGVNDAPALRHADIGVAMGRQGTDVARQAAGMVLLDDNFATIVAAVREGRRIFDNIRKFIKYTMTSNAGEIWTLALAPLLGLPLPLLPIHILWINLVTDGLPGLALTTQPGGRDLMQRPPRPARESMFSGGMWQHMLLVGLLIGALAAGTQAWALGQGIHAWQTMVFTVLTFSQLVHVLMIRNDRESFFAAGITQNPSLLGAVGLTILLQLAVIYLPALNTVFRTAPLGLPELGFCLALPLVLVPLLEAEKWLRRRQWTGS
jgi:Ca2+-transporting ATPase